MNYRHRDIPKGKKVTIIRLIKEYEGWGYCNFPKDLKVGDITWVEDFNHYHTHIEGNRYCGNFDPSYFEVVEYQEKKKKEPTYEIY